MFSFFRKINLNPFGMDISDASIEVLQLKKKGGRKLVSAFGRVRLEQGIVEDGKILNKEKLAEKIKEAVSTTKVDKLQTSRVILAIPESKTYVHIFKLPEALSSLSKSFFQDIVQAEIKKTIPLKFEDIYSDFQIIPSSKEIRFIAVLKNVVDDYIEVLSSANLEPIAFDMESLSLARVLLKNCNEATVIMDTGARTTIVSIFDENGLRFTTNIAFAGNQFTQLISEKLKVSIEEAEKLKRDCGFDPRKECGEILLILQSLFQLIIEETRRAFRYYQDQTQRKIKKIILCGGSSLIPQLPEYLSDNLEIETKIGDPWVDIDDRNLQTPEVLEFASKMSPILYATVIGLALRGLEREPETAGINLMPKKEGREPTFIGRKLNESKTFNFLATGLTMVAFVFLGWIIYTYIFKAF